MMTAAESHAEYPGEAHDLEEWAREFVKDLHGKTELGKRQALAELTDEQTAYLAAAAALSPYVLRLRDLLAPDAPKPIVRKIETPEKRLNDIARSARDLSDKLTGIAAALENARDFPSSRLRELNRAKAAAHGYQSLHAKFVRALQDTELPR